MWVPLDSEASGPAAASDSSTTVVTPAAPIPRPEPESVNTPPPAAELNGVSPAAAEANGAAAAARPGHNGSLSQNGSEPVSIEDVVRQAEQLKQSLRAAQTQMGELLSALKRHRRLNRLVRSRWASSCASAACRRWY